MQSFQIPAICIPRVYRRVTIHNIYDTFEHLFGLGCIQTLKMLRRTDHKTREPFWVVFIHFHPYTPPAYSLWGTNNRDSGFTPVIVPPNTNAPDGYNYMINFINILNIHGEVWVEYDTPYFWKIRNNGFS